MYMQQKIAADSSLTFLHIRILEEGENYNGRRGNLVLLAVNLDSVVVVLLRPYRKCT